MSIWIKALILGIIEGLTEFLPVSSTGHLIIVSDMLKLSPEFDNIFNVVIQMGAIISVILYFWRDIFPKDFSYNEVKSFVRLWLKVVVASIPAAVLALKFEDEIDKYLFNPTTVAIALIVGGIWILYFDEFKERRGKDSEHKYVRQTQKLENLSYLQAIKIGIFQCLALIPGASRSAMTIIGGLSSGASRELAAKFSFFMAIPILMGAGFIKLIKANGIFTPEEYMVLGLGTIVSFVVAYAVIAMFMNYIKRHKFTVFAYYRIALGLLVLVLNLFK